MDIKNKKTVLNDEAALYKHETDSLSEKEKLKNMNSAQKWVHFKQYYLLKVVFALVGAGVLASILITIFKPKPKEVFYACIFNGCIAMDKVVDIKNDYEKSLALDTEHYKTTFDSDFIYTGPYCEAVQRFAVLARSGTATVAIMPKSIFEMYAKNFYFEKMDDVLTEEELEIFMDKLVFVSKESDEIKEVDDSVTPYGILIGDCPVLSENVSSEPLVLAFMVGKKTDNYGKEFLKFLFANE